MRKTKIRVSNLILAFYFSICFIVFFQAISPALSGKSIDLRWTADSIAYINNSPILFEQGRLLSLRENYVGPGIILEALDYNNFLVLIFNIGLFFLSYLCLVRNIDINRVKLLSLLLINPIFFISLLAINKEILGLASIFFLVSYMGSHRNSQLLLAVALSIMARWHMTAVILIYLLLVSKFNPFRRSRSQIIFLLILGITICYPLFLKDVFQVITPVVETRQEITSFGLSRIANLLQSNFGFFIIVIPKIFFNYFGNLLRILDPFIQPENVNFKDIYNTYFLLAHQYLMLFVVILLVKKRRLSLKSSVIYFALLYSIIFSISLFIQYRYFFPVYVLFCIELAIPINKRLPGTAILQSLKKTTSFISKNRSIKQIPEMKTYL